MSNIDWHWPFIQNLKIHTFMIKNYFQAFLSALLVCFSLQGFAQVSFPFSSSGTWTCPSGPTSITVECRGAGGGGGGTPASTTAFGGGGAGGSYSKSVLAVTPGTTYTVTVGTAGTAGSNTGTNGGDGGDSWFGNSATILAKGGAGGGAGATGTPGAGGLGSDAGNIGDAHFKGGNGFAGSSTRSGSGGGGAGSTAAGGDASATIGGSAGANGGGAGATGRTTNGTGSAGTAPGGAGAGGFNNNSATGRAGGLGGGGTVIISYPGYCNPVGTATTSYFDAFSTTGGATNISNTASGYTAGGYAIDTNMVVTQMQGGSFNFNTVLAGTTVGVAIWIDWNDNSIFETSERVYVTTDYVSTASGTVAIPTTAPVGMHRMRAMMDYNSSVPSTPCTFLSGRGEVEDYTINVLMASVCSGAPAGVAISPVTNQACASFSGTFTATTTTVASGITYQWQSSPAGAGTWTDISGATSSIYAASAVTASTDYRCNVSCSGSTTNSNTASVVITGAPINDNYCNAIPLILDGASDCQNTTCATSVGDPSFANSTPNNTTWYSYTPATTGAVYFKFKRPAGITTNLLNGWLGIFTATGTCPGTLTFTEVTSSINYDLTSSDSVSIVSPSLTAGTTYYLMVDGYSSAYGAYCIAIASPQQMTYVSSTTEKVSSATIAQNTTAQNVIRLNVVTAGVQNPMVLTQLNFNTTGSTNPADIVNAKVYYTGTTTTGTKVLFGNAVVSPNGNFSVTGSQILAGGVTNTNNYFLLTYDVTCNATVTDTIDAQCTDFVAGGITQIPAVTNPAGSSVITALTNTVATSQPATGAVLAGSSDQQVLRISATGCAMTNVTALNLSTTGTINAADITTAKVYFTTTTTFATTTQFGATYVNPSGNFTITGSQTLGGTTGYFWLVYDIASSATAGDVLDASCISIQNNNGILTPLTANPTGTRTIVLPITNDEAPGAILLTVGGGCTGNPYDNTGATQSTSEPFPNCKGTSGYAGMWYKFVAPASGSVKVSCDGSGTLGDSRMALFSTTNANDYGTFNILSCDDDNGVTAGSRSLFYTTGLTPNNTYYVLVDLYSSTSVRGTYCVTVDELSSSMLTTTAGDCISGQSVSITSASYKGWISLVDADGNLNANVRQTAGTATDFSALRTIKTAAPRVDINGLPYLNRNFLISATGATSADVQLFFTDAELSNLGASLPSLNVSKVSGSVCNANFSGTATVLTQTLNQTANGVDYIQVTTPGFSNFYIMSGTSPLPIAFEYFKGRKINNANNLTWKINAINETEMTLDLERSEDGKSFMGIQQQTVNAARCLAPFEYTDNDIHADVNYYRVKATNSEGRINYSQIVTLVNKAKGFEVLNIAPNPVKNLSVLNMVAASAGNINIIVSDVVGKVLMKQNANITEGSNSLDMNFSSLAAGTYQLTIINEEGHSQTLRFVKN
jgi:hypothetical protein